MFTKNLIIAWLVVLISACSSLPKEEISCKHHNVEEFIGLIKLMGTSCDNTGVCDIGFRFPRSFDQWKFQKFGVFIPSSSDARKAFSARLKTYGKEDSTYLTSEVSGENSFLESVSFKAYYKGEQYCFVSSELKLKFNKKRNRMDTS